MSHVATLSGRQALATAERLMDVDDVLECTSGRAGASLARGLAGTALLHARLSASDRAFEEAAKRQWSAAAALAREHGRQGCGIFNGLGGLAASLIIGTGYLPESDSHHQARASAAKWLSRHAADLAGRHRRYLDDGGIGTRWVTYDAISGLAGVGRVLLAALTAGHREAEPGLLAAIRTLVTMINSPGGSRPGWWVPSAEHPQTVDVDPSGAATIGMAHGIAGPLAFLALAETSGWSIAGQRSAIGEVADWLLRWRHETPSDWPPYVTGHELDQTNAKPAASGRRDAWCYGGPGIGRALILAGHALDDPALTEAGQAAIAALASREGQWDADGPTLCHGNAGLLQCVARDSPAVLSRAASAITSAFDPAHPFGFQHHGRDAVVDKPGLLIGSAGVGLVLADYAGLPTHEHATSWDAILLLA